MTTFSAGESVKFGWETFKMRPWIFVGTTLIILIISSISSSISKSVENVPSLSFVVFLLSFGVSALLDMGLTAFVLKAQDAAQSLEIKDLWHPQPFWYYLGATLLTAIAVGIGFILLIVPGVILALMFFFAKFLVIDRGLNPIAALKESMRITKGHKLELFGLLFFAILINILGALAFLVGLLVSIPVTTLAIAHAYRVLSHESAEVVAA